MSRKEPKTYIVWSGSRPGIYDSWEDCKRQVLGVKGAKYKSFTGISPAEAQRLLAEGPDRFYHSPRVPRDKKERVLQAEEVRRAVSPDAIAVDASSRRNPGPMEYRGVFVETGDEVFHSRVYPVGTNNIGEFLAIVHALAWEEQVGYFVPIYSDSRNALNWIRKGVCKTKLPRDARTEQLFGHIDRALAWLRRHDLSRFDLRKWETDSWGEIPADFGRK